MSLNEVSIKIPGEYIPNVFGQFDAFAKKIERTLHVTLVLRDDSLKIIGAQGNICYHGIQQIRDFCFFCHVNITFRIFRSGQLLLKCM